MTRALRSHYVWRMRRLEFKGAFVDVRDACEQCGNVVGGRSLIFVHMFSWSCVHLSRHCVDSGGSGLILIFLFQRHVLCVVPFVTLPSVCSHFTWKDSWCERHTNHVRRGKSIAIDAALQSRSHVAVSAVASQLSAYHGQASRETVQAFGQVPKRYACRCPQCCLCHV